MYLAGVGLDGNLSEILKDLDDTSKHLPDLAIVERLGAYSELEGAQLICGNFVVSSFSAARSLGAMVQSRKRGQDSSASEADQIQTVPIHTDLH